MNFSLSLDIRKGMSMNVNKMMWLSKVIFVSASIALLGCESDNNSAELIRAVELERLRADGTIIEIVEIADDQYRLRKGETHQLSATGLDSNGDTRDITNELTWSSSDDSIAIVSNKGLVTAISNSTVNMGIITITAVTINGMLDEGEISVSNVDVTAISLKQSLPKTGNVYTCIDARITGDVSYEDGYISYNTVKDMSFSLDDESSAVIDNEGNLYTSAENIESTIVTAKISDVTGTLAVTADPHYLQNIDILVNNEITTLFTLNIGKRLQVSGQANLESEVSEDNFDINNSINWTQEEAEKVGLTATDENKGTIFGLKPGVTQLIGHCGGVQSTATIEVKGEANLDAIQINDGGDIISLSPLASVELTLVASYVSPVSSMNVSEFAQWDINGSNLFSDEITSSGTNKASYKLTSISDSTGVAIVSVTYDGITSSVRINIE